MIKVLTTFAENKPQLNLDREIFRISIPNIISNISIPLIGIVDTALMGRLNDPAYIGAIAIGGIIFNILYWGLGFLRPGTTGLTAQAFGKGNMDEAYRLLWRALVVGVILGLIIWLFKNPIGTLSLGILDGSDKVKSWAFDYYNIRIWAAPAVLALLAFRGWFFGMQNAMIPMVLTIFTNLLNVGLSWYLVVHQDMEVAGVAWGTVLAQWISLLLCLVLFIFYFNRHKFLSLFNLSLLKAEELKKFLFVNRDMFIRNMGLVLVFSFFTNQSSKLGDEYLAINQILLELFYLMSYTVDGFAYASESLVGKYLGANNFERIRLIIKKCLIYGLGLGGLFAIAYYVFGDYILQIFTTNQALIAQARPYYFWCALVAISGALAFIWDGVYSGATASVELRNSMLFSVAAFFICFYFVDKQSPLYAVWAGMVAFMLTRSIVQILLYQRVIVKGWV